MNPKNRYFSTKVFTLCIYIYCCRLLSSFHSTAHSTLHGLARLGFLFVKSAGVSLPIRPVHCTAHSALHGLASLLVRQIGWSWLSLGNGGFHSALWWVKAEIVRILFNVFGSKRALLHIPQWPRWLSLGNGWIGPTFRSRVGCSGFPEREKRKI